MHYVHYVCLGKIIIDILKYVSNAPQTHLGSANVIQVTKKTLCNMYIMQILSLRPQLKFPMK